MTASTTIRAEHAAAVRKVNAEFARLPAAVQESIDLCDEPVDQAVDAAIIAGDPDRALTAIAAWRDRYLERIAEARG